MSEIVEFVEEVAGIYFRSVFLPTKGLMIPQHVHDHDHATLCGSGAARMFVEDEAVQDIQEGFAVKVEAGKRHAFLALKDNTRLTCVHDVSSADSLKSKGL